MMRVGAGGAENPKRALSLADGDQHRGNEGGVRNRRAIAYLCRASRVKREIV
jgi:hypothetical protein